MKRRRNFWREWHRKRRRHGRHGPPGMKARAWRDFFHEFMGAWPEEHWAIGGRRFHPWHEGVDAFNPFVASLLTKGGGLLPLYVLRLLADEPLYGNELMDKITERTGGRWVANPGAIYPLLTMLEKQGLIAGEWEDPEKRTVRVYRLTESGREELLRLKAVVGPKVKEAIAVLKVLNQDLNGETDDGDDKIQSF